MCRIARMGSDQLQSAYRTLFDIGMMATLHLNDHLLADAKALAAQQRNTRRD